MKNRSHLYMLALALTVAACTSDDPVAPQTRDIVETAAEAGSFSTLLAAAEAAELVEVLKGEGPFTLFAPTDQAFADLPEGTVEALLEDIDTLTEILTYHVVAGRITSADIVAAGGGQPVTVQGQTLNVEVAGGMVRVDGALVTTADIDASNGVIHVIDAVLLP